MSEDARLILCGCLLLVAVGLVFLVGLRISMARRLRRLLEQLDPPQYIDDLSVQRQIVDGREWWIWWRITDGARVDATMASEVSITVRLCERPRRYRLVRGRWVRA